MIRYSTYDDKTFVHYMGIGSLSNHDERDDDDVKYARRDWDENVAFSGKMKLKQ